jgi:hypothetical protein
MSETFRVSCVVTVAADSAAEAREWVGGLVLYVPCMMAVEVDGVSEADALRAELRDLQDAVSAYLTEPKIDGRHARAGARLNGLRNRWLHAREKAEKAVAT